MRKTTPATSPQAYLEGLDGWRQEIAGDLRRTVTAAAELEETIKWGHLVYSASGPVLLIRAEESRVLLGFWRGARLRGIEPRLKPGGKYEMATLEIREGTPMDLDVVGNLVREAVALNRHLGDPTQLPPSR